MAIKTYVTFKINDELFGINILTVREINRQLDATMVPQSPAYIFGLINLRGQIVTLVDLKKRLSLGETQMNEHTHTIILNLEGDPAHVGRSDMDKVGILVDAIGDIVEVDENALESPPANLGDLDGSYLDEVVKLDNSVVAILNIGRVMESVA
jgi:purine-binding chemotaxis protein CheW